MRERTLNIRMSEEEYLRINRLSESLGINNASLIRMMLKKLDDETSDNARANASVKKRVSKRKRMHGSLNE